MGGERDTCKACTRAVSAPSRECKEGGDLDGQSGSDNREQLYLPAGRCCGKLEWDQGAGSENSGWEGLDWAAFEPLLHLTAVRAKKKKKKVSI